MLNVLRDKHESRRLIHAPYQARARELCLAAGVDPDTRIERPGLRSMPAWCAYRDAARTISFGVGCTNEERVEHELFDDADA
jgi:hypothetical protein